MAMETPASAFRLLYRGALSLPDSHLLLDGLTFAVRLDSGNNSLLESPLALALETMRGRPSLRWMGTAKLADTHLDESGGISLDIHPAATLTRIYFENTFCLAPAQAGIKVALGDSDGPETTLMLIYARPQPDATQLQLLVARITPAPPPPSVRLPRPDDPTPRRPPLRFDAGNPFATRKRTASVASLGSGVRVGLEPVPESSASFKVPAVPRAGKERAVDNEDDVFGPDLFGGAVENKGKRRREADAESEVEKANRTIIKQSTVHLLPIPKSHPEYKDIYGAVHRGVAFALRASLKKSAVDIKAVERLVKTHVNMYVPSEGRSK
ncbi:hypothetical protein B0H12DRAFT_171230 [Mycena haematopus]|nr:hypothetical protein B0H12DRAFT_171230 [Mycena haematopus]